MSSDKKLPPRLEDELNNAKMYKISASNLETNSQKLAKVFDDSKERAMYDEILGPMLGNRNTNAFGNVLAKPSPVTAVSNIDFNSSILNRLKAVETEAKNSRVKLAEQAAANEKLREENTLLKSMVNGSSGTVDEVAKLKKQNVILQSKVHDMETFLGDYGLVWVGKRDEEYESDQDDEANRLENDEVPASANASQPTHKISFAEFNRHIDELNAVIYAEPAQVVTEGNNQRKARLVQASELLENVRVVFYRNGLMIKRGPFRACGTSGYKSFVKDILDGYFPSEFQGEYPDGVLFELKDQHGVDYIEGRTEAYSEQSKMSKTQLLNRLPKTVIHKGQVVGVRGEIDDILASSSSGTGRTTAGAGASMVSAAEGGNSSVALKTKVVIDTPASNTDKIHHESMGKLVQIQVKWVDQSTFIAKLYEHNTVGDLKTYIQQHFDLLGSKTNNNNNDSKQSDSKECGNNNTSSSSSANTADSKSNGNDIALDRKDSSTATDGDTNEAGVVGFDFELRSAYPPRALGLFLSLKEAGLVPNGTVHARKLD